ncbi:hypothetical protein MtrunA17_Chr4g0031881 [Medicago truncatula]|uniref:Transmembrane protein n=1 Tax=Medicago truncatula TaxID=3880 RepID=A0A396I5Y2_MEDTR|nr:hypothetical protein MtrunA17_Chr4g0031881 [Medicago truncatula]
MAKYPASSCCYYEWEVQPVLCPYRRVLVVVCLSSLGVGVGAFVSPLLGGFRFCPLASCPGSFGGRLGDVWWLFGVAPGVCLEGLSFWCFR